MLFKIKTKLIAIHAIFLVPLQWFFYFCARGIDVLEAQGPTLVIAPHPDDETLGVGATIARLRAAQKVVRIVVVTNGAASGHSKIVQPKELAERRRREALDASLELGVSAAEVVFLDFPDQGTTEQSSAVEAALADQIRIFSPAQIFSPYGFDGHADHRAIAASVDRLCRAGIITCPVYEYPIWFWTWGALDHLLHPMKLARLRYVPTRGFIDFKIDAIVAHRSQLQPLTDEPGWFTFTPSMLTRFFRAYELFFEKPRQNR
jgi:LmbE family N-acetylglucosaminyl deacetylase